MLDLAHAQIPFGAIVGERYVGVAGEEQHGGLVCFESFPEVMGIGLGDSAALAILSDRQGRQFSFAAGQGVTVSFLQVLVLAGRKFFAFALRDLGTGLLRWSK